jgi:hypothetical protein
VNEIPSEAGLEEHKKSIVDGTIHKVIDQKIKTHSRTNAKGTCESQGNTVTRIENGRFSLGLEPCIKGLGI